MLPVVIYNGEPRWTAATDIADLLPPGIGQLLGRAPRLWYLLIEIREQDPDSLPLHNVLATMARFEQAPKLLPLLGRLTDHEDIVAVADAVIECTTAEEFLKRVDAPGERTAAG